MVRLQWMDATGRINDINGARINERNRSMLWNLGGDKLRVSGILWPILANTIIYFDELLTRTTFDGEQQSARDTALVGQEGTKLTVSCAPAMHQTESIVRPPHHHHRHRPSSLPDCTSRLLHAETVRN